MFNQEGLKIRTDRPPKNFTKSMNLKSKLRSIKSLATIIGLFSIIVFQGCDNEEFDSPQNDGLCDVTEIAINELPDGVNPIVVNSEEEFNKIIDQLNNLDVKATNSTSNKIISKKDGKIVVGVSVKELEKLHITRLKSKSLELGIVDVPADAGGLSVLIHLAYTTIGGSVSVSSTESSSSFFLGWKQTAGVAAFSGTTNIQYSVRGDVIAYVLFETALFEINRKNYSIDGTVNINL